MKTINILLLAGSLLVGKVAVAQTGSFGKKITEQGAVPATELVRTMAGAAEKPAKITGTVESVCQMKGCWMTLKTADGQTMRVTFRDYGFFVPKDIAGKTVVLQGTAQQTTTSVARLRHYAEDAGKPKAEIERITQPETTLNFVADGVIVK
jgi:Domain of unknown function (DUF4920)